MRRIIPPHGFRSAQILPSRSPTAVQTLTSRRPASTNATENNPQEADGNSTKATAAEKGLEELAAKRKKTVTELDEELRLKLEGISGDGGVSGLELENGKAVAMKRGVRENMFRLI